MITMPSPSPNSSARLLVKTLFLLAAFCGSASAANKIIGRIDAVAEGEGVGVGDDPNPTKKVSSSSAAAAASPHRDAPVIDRRKNRKLKMLDPFVWPTKAAKAASFEVEVDVFPVLEDIIVPYGKTSGSVLTTYDTGNFLKFAMKTLEEINETICEKDEATCTQISQLVVAGERFKVLPEFIYVNFLAMTVAYPTVFQESPFFLEALRIHRALGLGNAQLFQGYSEETVNRLYWSYYYQLEILDKNIQPMGDGIETYCEYIADEYQTLKDFAVANYDGENVFANVLTFGQNPMFSWCLGLDGSSHVSFIIRSDWEHHRSEVVGSLMNSAYTETMVTHTILHWESLFSTLVDPGSVIPLFFQSFDVFLQE
jgi:hypothetical protein